MLGFGIANFTVGNVTPGTSGIDGGDGNGGNPKGIDGFGIASFIVDIV